MPIRLFVGNLPYDTTEAELKDHFSTIAPVAYLTIPKDRETGRSRNFAFVEFSERAQAEEAIRQLNNQLFNGRPLAVSEARPREEGRSTSAPTRPPLSRSYSTGEPMAAPPAPPSGDKPNRNFGPDAAPPRRGKGKGAPKSERASKGPMREVVRGQFVGGDDDDDYDDYDDDGYDYEDDNDGSTAEDFADHAKGAEREDDQ
jgi:RNA recognition motif-containing protein